MDRLAAVLAGRGGREEADRFVACLPPGYQERTTPEEAASDLDEMRTIQAVAHPQGAHPDGNHPEGDGAQGVGERVTGAAGGQRFGGRHRLVVRPRRDSDGDQVSFRLRRFGVGGVELTGFLPVLESFGLVVTEAVPFRLASMAPGGRAVHVDDFGVRLVAADPRTAAVAFDPVADGDRLVAALNAVARDYCDVDSLNRLVTLAGLEWGQVSVIRAYRRYWRQGASTLSDRQMDDPLAAYPEMARALIEYFQARFDPTRAGDVESTSTARKRVLSGLDGVTSLEADGVLRGYLALIDATLRTSYFRPDGLGHVEPEPALVGAGSPTDPPPRSPGTLTLKLDSARVPDLPAPRPLVETWVHGPGVEGVHLRAGLVARGGIRWSDRGDDFRTEVLDLAMAQVKKNAIIVPTGAKGGFVYRRRAAPSPLEVREAYETFITSLLDITDNLVGRHVVRPEGVVAHDGDDSYLVVAADKGTATFSDVANALSEARRFWLGDAFASGGSRGYDHKAMGITAKGAWVAVRRHFHQLGIDVQSEPIRVVGVGDMSGDVFGNGMLRSETLRLIAAFDHRHVFVDPDPDPATSFGERRRLAGLGRSSWADYDPALISPGGGVWSRTEKRILLSDPVRRALGVDAAQLSGPELISAVLGAPVDLLWFGGIGTYIKASGQSDLEVGDHANDGVRITTDQVRVRVIAEGANLGITQAARIRYSRRGGRINTDFIDNAAGVATSDREVNLKILLALAVQEGQLDLDGRDALLSACEDDVADAVLRQVDHSVAALNRAVPASAAQLDAYEALLETLERGGRLDRSVEDLPSLEEIAVRRQAGAGLIRPELAVLLAYAKSQLVAAIEDSRMAGDASLRDVVEPYFPGPIRERFTPLITRHPLYRQLQATNLAGEIVDQMGVIWAHETADELGRHPVDVAAAFWAARQVLDAETLWHDLEAGSASLDADAEQQLHQLVVDAVDALARSYLHRPGPIDPTQLISDDRPLVAAMAASGQVRGLGQPEDWLVAQGVEREMAARYLAPAALARLGDANQVSRQVDQPLATVVDGLAGIDRVAGVDRLVNLIRRIPPGGRWASWQARALLDDIASWRRAAIHDALTSAPGAAPSEAIAKWQALHSEGLRRSADLLDQLDPQRPDALTLASLILRSLRRTQRG